MQCALVPVGWTGFIDHTEDVLIFSIGRGKTMGGLNSPSSDSETIRSLF
jgi:hypothetical protein